MAEVDPKSTSEQWLSTFASLLQTGDTRLIPSLFIPNGYLRDSLVFSWDVRTLQGLDNIRDFLSDKLAVNAFRNFRLETDSPYLYPALDKSDPAHERINAFFLFETERALCRGAVTLVQAEGEDGHSAYKAVSVYIAVADWKGHEEAPYINIDNQASAGCTRNEALPQSDPTVLIRVRGETHELPISVDNSLVSHGVDNVVGAGQTGLQLAARLRQSGVSYVILEKEPRVGDNWRKRFPSLALHVPRNYCQLLYQSYPSDYPEYIPKDLVADWLEAYALAQNLYIWTSSTLEGAPSYDAATGTWTVCINKNNQQITLHPKHLILALGPFGEGNTPEIEGRDTFKGSQIHSERFPGGEEYKNKRVLVVGAANSASDISMDLVRHGAKSVTLFQRSPSLVHSRKYIRSSINVFFPDNVPMDITDFKIDSIPSNLLIEITRGLQTSAREYDKEMLNALQEAGLKLWDGPSGAGYVELALKRGGGYLFDSGFASLVSNGTVKIKSDSGIVRLTEDAAVFSDGSDLEVDAIVYTTGFKPVRETYKQLLGEEFVEPTPHVWSLDKEGEISGLYRPTGRPGFWYAAGDFAIARRSSKRLALLIKAIELGYYVQ